MLQLNYGLKFEDLYSSQGLAEVDRKFIDQLSKDNADLYHRLMLVRSDSSSFTSALLIELSQYLESFIADLFGVTEHVLEAKLKYISLTPLIKCKRDFIQRKVGKQPHIPEHEILTKIESVREILLSAGINLEDEESFAEAVMLWQKDNNSEMLNYAHLYASWALFTAQGRERYKESLLFQLPKKISYDALIDVQHNPNTGAKEHKGELRNRNGFSLNDGGASLAKASVQANYCIYCHNQQKDSCSHGLHDKSTNNTIVSPLGIKLEGCPLDEKISEMNYLKANHSVIAPLAVAMIDNPMLAATGHRICNDCMRSCIYQKQEPVDIPFIETQTLYDVLHLPWGFEIYSLLSRWNPLKYTYLAKPVTQYKTLVVGLGPAGFTLAHYLLNEGINVVAIDGLKIEPLDSDISGITQDGARVPFRPIQDVKELYEDLNERVASGFGGVAEYGITVRWDKNYLKIIRLLLERRSNFRMYGSTRFGSGITYEKSKELGFDHIALAVGAGKPNLPDLPNILAKGVRTASDFLMTLQLSGAAKINSLSNLQIALPIVVVGGGLTAVDVATEALNYYALQVEKFLHDYEKIGDKLLSTLNATELKLAHTFIEHAKELRKSPKHKSELLKQWGGATIAYRKGLNDSPSYRLNYEEIAKALEEGIQFLENIQPISISIDEDGHCNGLEHIGGIIPARSILIATGTKPNTVAATEEPQHFKLNNQYFRTTNAESVLIEDNYLSCFGDAHPLYAGNVVKAMASAKHGYKDVISAMCQHDPANHIATNEFFSLLDSLLIARIEHIERLTPDIIEVVVKAPLAASTFQPGQFYRLQNYEYNALTVNGKIGAIEPLALTGAGVCHKSGTLSFIILEMGASSNLCASLKNGEIISLMGPTGSPTKIPKGEKVLLIGGGLGNAVLFSIGKALRNNGNQVLYFAGYKRAVDRYKKEEIEEAADFVVWCCDEKILEKSRELDFSFNANIIKAIELYSQQSMSPLPLSDIDRMLVIGSDSMMAAVANAKNTYLKQLFKPNIPAFASINSPMQCMMKEICAQCLQKHIDPKTGKEFYVYSCSDQDQNIDTASFAFLAERLKQNSLLEKTSLFFIKPITL